MKKKISITSFLLVVSLWVAAQAPAHVPYGKPEPVDFTPLNIILFFCISTKGIKRKVGKNKNLKIVCSFQWKKT